jgi:hypothetical protein
MLSAALISRSAKRMIECENILELQIKTPQNINKSFFLRTFSDFFSVVNGFSFSVNKVNALAAHSIGTQLLNQELINLLSSILSTEDVPKSALDRLIYSCEYGFSVENDLIDSVASKLYIRSNKQISQLPIPILSRILSSNSLKIQNEDNLFELLRELYSTNTEY